MKRLSSLIVALVITLALSLPALANTCPKLMKQVDAKLSSMSLPAEQVAKIKVLRDRGEAEHKAGKHDASVATLKEALAMLEQK